MILIDRVFGERVFMTSKDSTVCDDAMHAGNFAVTAAVPLTEANATAFFHFHSQRARVKPQWNARWSRDFQILPFENHSE